MTYTLVFSQIKRFTVVSFDSEKRFPLDVALIQSVEDVCEIKTANSLTGSVPSIFSYNATQENIFSFTLLTKSLLEIEETWKRGRPRKTWWDCVKRDMQNFACP